MKDSSRHTESSENMHIVLILIRIQGTKHLRYEGVLEIAAVKDKALTLPTFYYNILHRGSGFLVDQEKILKRELASAFPVIAPSSSGGCN